MKSGLSLECYNYSFAPLTFLCLILDHLEPVCITVCIMCIYIERQKMSWKEKSFSIEKKFHYRVLNCWDRSRED